jgi:hypothetical protein
VILGYFIGSQYVTTSNTTFISLEKNAGICVDVPVAVTNIYTLDENGYWSGKSDYNPSTGMYTLIMSSFNHSLSEYNDFMAGMRQTVAYELASKSVKQDLSQNLLDWMAWAKFVDEGTNTQRWQLTGDPKIVNNRNNYVGTLSNDETECHRKSSVTYDLATGRFKLTFSYSEYNQERSCYTILKPDDIGYDAMANGDDLSLNWDGVSLILARAVNKGVSGVSYSSHVLQRHRGTRLLHLPHFSGVSYVVFVV